MARLSTNSVITWNDLEFINQVTSTSNPVIGNAVNIEGLYTLLNIYPYGDSSNKLLHFNYLAYGEAQVLIFNFTFNDKAGIQRLNLNFTHVWDEPYDFRFPIINRIVDSVNNSSTNKVTHIGFYVIPFMLIHDDSNWYSANTLS